MITLLTQFCSALPLSSSKPHFLLEPGGVSKAKGRCDPGPGPLLSKAIQCFCNWTTWLFPRLGSPHPQASLQPFLGLSQATPTWPDCSLSADLVERQKQEAHVEAGRVKEGDLLVGLTLSFCLPREPLVSQGDWPSKHKRREATRTPFWASSVSNDCCQPWAAGIPKP